MVTSLLVNQEVKEDYLASMEVLVGDNLIDCNPVPLLDWKLASPFAQGLEEYLEHQQRSLAQLNS